MYDGNLTRFFAYGPETQTAGRPEGRGKAREGRHEACLIHPRRAHRRDHHPRDPRYGRIPFALGLFGRRAYGYRESERASGVFRNPNGIDHFREFPEVLREP